jgi:hypothetical protein
MAVAAKVEEVGELAVRVFAASSAGRDARTPDRGSESQLVSGNDVGRRNWFLA